MNVWQATADRTIPNKAVWAGHDPFNGKKLENGEFSVENTIPYADIDHLSNPDVREIAESDGYIRSHTLENQIQGQIAAGCAIVGFYEDIGGTALDQYIKSSMATKAIKL